MANNIKLIEKWLPGVTDTVFAESSKTALLETGSKYIDLNFSGAGEVRVMDILMDGLSDYYRANHAGISGSDAYANYNGQNGEGFRDGFHRGNVQAQWTTYKLQWCRGKQFEIDYLDDEEVAGQILANLLKEFIRTKLVPEVDACRFSSIAGRCNATLGNLVTESVASLANTIIAKFNSAFEWLTEHEVPEDEQIIFVSPTVFTAIMSSSEITRYITQEDFRSEKGITFALKAYLGRPIVVVPSDRFYTGIVTGENGYAPASGSKVINYLVCSKKAVVAPVKLDYTKVFSPEVVQDFHGYKVNVLYYHGCIIPKNKIVGCFCSVSDVSATTKTNKLDIAMKEGSVTNAYYIDEVYTTPAGLLGTLVTAQTAFTLGATVTVDGEDVAYAPIKADIVDATNTKAYFALLDGANKVVACSAQITLTKKA